MLSFKIRRQLLRLLHLASCFLLFVGITTGEEYVVIVVSIFAITMLLSTIIQCTTYCPFCKSQLFGCFIATHTTGAELFKFVLGIKMIKCHGCKKIIDTNNCEKWFPREILRTLKSRCGFVQDYGRPVASQKLN